MNVNFVSIMALVYLSLGSNLGNRLQFLLQAEDIISIEIGEILNKSSVYETTPWGFDTETRFLNSVLCVETFLSPIMVLDKLLAIEKQLGRIRVLITQGYAARTIDIDILLYDDIIIDQDNLKIPHPLLHLRKFVLVPLAQINQQLIHPIIKCSIIELIHDCTDKEEPVLFK